MNDMIDELEKASLLPDRWYIIMKEAEDGFTISAYDTMQSEEFQEMGSVIMSGIIDILHNDFDTIFDAGVKAMKSQEDEIVIKAEGDNIVKVDFGRQQ
tara:strand:+ start:847 stop:1140 length:294 start_codon:yes stop_codon:yes gene_type:complete